MFKLITLVTCITFSVCKWCVCSLSFNDRRGVDKKKEEVEGFDSTRVENMMLSEQRQLLVFGPFYIETSNVLHFLFDLSEFYRELTDKKTLFNSQYRTSQMQCTFWYNRGQ